MSRIYKGEAKSKVALVQLFYFRLITVNWSKSALCKYRVINATNLQRTKWLNEADNRRFTSTHPLIKRTIFGTRVLTAYTHGEKHRKNGEFLLIFNTISKYNVETPLLGVPKRVLGVYPVKSGAFSTKIEGKAPLLRCFTM